MAKNRPLRPGESPAVPSGGGGGNSNHHPNRPVPRHTNRGGGGGGGKGVSDGGLYTGDTGEYGAQTDPNAYYNFLLSQQGITPDSVPSDVWNYTQNQGFNDWYTGYTNALGSNKKLTLAQYAGQDPATEAPNKHKNPNQYHRWMQNGGDNQSGVGAGLANPIDPQAIATDLFRDQAEQDPQAFYNTQLQRSGQMNAPGAAQGYDAFVKQDQFNNRYSQYQLARQQGATGVGVAGAGGGGFGGATGGPGGGGGPGHGPGGLPHIGAPGAASGLYDSWYANQQSMDPQHRLQQDNAAFNALTPGQKAYRFGVQNPFDRSRVVNWA